MDKLKKGDRVQVVGYGYFDEELGTVLDVDLGWGKEKFIQVSAARASVSIIPIRVIYNNPATILFYRDFKNSPTWYKAVAMCHPRDTYYENKGKMIAFKKAVIAKARREIEQIGG